MIAVWGVASLGYAAERPMVGKWISSKRSAGGIGHILALMEDGTAGSTTAVILDCQLDNQQQQVILGGSEDQPVRYAFMIRDSHLVLTRVESGKEILAQKAEGAPESVLGKWTYKNDFGADVFLEIAERACYFTIPLSQYFGTYTLREDTITFKLSGVPGGTQKYQLEDHHLTLIADDGTQYRYFKKP